MPSQSTPKGQKFSHWLDAAAALKARGEGFVVVTVLAVTGSAPRDAGTKMLVTDEGIVQTIGGGHLEYLAIAEARKLLSTKTPEQQSQKIEEYPLGARLGQCCGGRVTLLYECYRANHINLTLFGAGHVGRALVTILSALHMRITWVDTRASEFPEQIPDGVTQVISDKPDDEILDIPAGGYVVVMTHNHTLDFDIVRAALAREDLAYLGVIGSQTKANRFRNRLAARDFSEQKIAQMHCPIGLTEVPGKHPMEVAVSVAGQIISHYQQNLPTKHLSPNHLTTNKPASWKPAALLPELESANQNEATQAITHGGDAHVE